MFFTTLGWILYSLQSLIFKGSVIFLCHVIFPCVHVSLASTISITTSFVCDIAKKKNLLNCICLYSSSTSCWPVLVTVMNQSYPVTANHFYFHLHMPQFHIQSHGVKNHGISRDSFFLETKLYSLFF